MTCLTLTILLGLPRRQTAGLVEMARPDWRVPCHSTPCRREARISVQIPYSCSSQPLIESAGLRFRTDGDGPARSMVRRGSARSTWQRTPRKAISARSGSPPTGRMTHTVALPRSSSARPNRSGSPSGQCRHALTPDPTAWSHLAPAAISPKEILRAVRYPGRTLWKRWAGTHIRNRIEARNNRLKLFGKRIMSRDPHRQTAVIQIRITIMNRCPALRRAETVA